MKNLRNFTIISAVIALIITLVSIAIGSLMAPGVFFKIGGDFPNITLPEQAKAYVVQVFVSFFISSLVACYATNYVLKRNT